MLESILHAIGVSSLQESMAELPWYILAQRLPDMRLPVLAEYGIETLGECGDPVMSRYVEPYLKHPHESVRAEAIKAIRLLKSVKQMEDDQMESPQSWNLLTASLAVSDLSDPEFVWAFLAVQRLVQDRPNDRRSFIELLRRERERGPITGPSLAARVASGLSTNGITRSEFNATDPDANIASERLKVIGLWIGAET